MGPVCLGGAGFLLFLLYDINSFTLRSRLLHCAFGAGAAAVTLATAWDLWAAWEQGAIGGAGDWALIAGGAACLWALVYCLFFALPFHDTYQAQDGVSPVQDAGVYALCRHPGVWCFLGVYLCLGAAALPGRLLLHGLLLSLWNVIYVVFQDLVTFPRTIDGYEAYKKRAPFLLPNGGSIRRAWRTWGRPGKKEDHA